ncbi:hypothetical protein H206_06315 [Candidatus Electrothrix aarhusensis]|uniref:Uncharacterized protein n=1 Tax=Candidatus Electrothrix aarhusensis TaxID=1859131 RepID=A0A3S3UDD0_9BACT|nr:hypothetical protein H206_06315 [Candidatus Electrothrix aarhusensis]
MPPPDLAGNAPITDIIHPGIKAVVPGIGIDVDAPVPDSSHSFVSQGPD